MTFAEQIPGLTTAYARRTAALTSTLTAIALSLAGRAGSRLAATLGMTAGRDLLLALIRAQPDPQVPELSVLGIDDFALRRGHRYGTILIDMHTHRPVEVLPDRESATVATWLAARPGIEIVCRDRAGAYAEAVRISLPDAIQVADRFHLWRNLGEAVDKTVRAHHHCHREAPAKQQPEPADDNTAAHPSSSAVPLNAYGHPSKLAARTIERHALVRSLIEQGHSKAHIAREQDLDPRTVKRFATAEHPDQLLGCALGRSSLLDDYKPYLLERVAEGCTQANTLHTELQARGWRGSIQTVRRFVFPLRDAKQLPPPPPPRVREIARWIMTDPAQLTNADGSALSIVRARCLELDALNRHVSTFATMMRELSGHNLRTWCADVHADDLPALHSLADGFLRDEEAVTAGLHPALELRRGRRRRN